MSDMSYTAVMGRRNQIMKAAVGLDYTQFESGGIAFDYEAMMAACGMGLDEVAREIHRSIHSHRVEAYYDGSGTIGRRYARMDEIGTPWCITVDYEALEGEHKGTVTIRDRDTSLQKRIPIGDCGRIVGELLEGKPFDAL